MNTETTSLSSNGIATAFAVGSVLASVGCVAYIAMNGMPPREAYLHPVNSVGAVSATVGVVVLALALARWRTTTLPAWAILCAAAGLVMIAPNAWFDATGVRAVAGQVDNAEFERLFFEEPWILAMLVPKAVLGLVGFIALGLAGWRHQSLPRSSGVLLVLAGVASLWPPYAPGLLLASAAFFVASRSTATREGRAS
ncbi:MAG: hypothetical protein ACRDT4_16805 [Micromonosporaceae bacterium]